MIFHTMLMRFALGEQQNQHLESRWPWQQPHHPRCVCSAPALPVTPSLSLCYQLGLIYDQLSASSLAYPTKLGQILDILLTSEQVSMKSGSTNVKSMLFTQAISRFLCTFAQSWFFSPIPQKNRHLPSCSQLTLPLVSSLYSLPFPFSINFTFSINLYLASGSFSFAFKSVQSSLNK